MATVRATAVHDHSDVPILLLDKETTHDLLDLQVGAKNAQLEQKPKELVSLLLRRSQDWVPVGLRELPTGIERCNLHRGTLDENVIPLDQKCIITAEKSSNSLRHDIPLRDSKLAQVVSGQHVGSRLYSPVDATSSENAFSGERSSGGGP
jgi:hypothetical protein